MRQILINLLSNAVKFTPEGGEVTITAERGVDGSLTLVIADTGIGMTKDEIAIALEPFRQVENALTKKYEGTGLGLPIARRLVELHGGRLDIASTKNIGTVIRVYLPRRARDRRPGRRVAFAQCDSKSGNRLAPTTSRVAPPNRNSRHGIWP